MPLAGFVQHRDIAHHIDEIDQVQAMLVAIQVAPFIQDMELKKSLAQLKKVDPNLKIREAARKALTQFE